MARGVNKVILVGHVGKDPDVRSMPNGAAVVTVSVATSEAWTDKQSGQKQEKTEWHRVVYFGKLADTAGKYLQKGSLVYVEGNLRTRQWEKDGQKRYTTEIIGQSMQMLDRKTEENKRLNDNGSQPSYTAPTESPADDFSDDIPF